ncbi:MAG: hypothetical protein LBN09_08120 [Clostridioides sp.]|jgi:hypothetical protein|nr:hypothetical protein [Clostridioides sp.]
MEEYNSDSFEKLKNTLEDGRFPKSKDEIILSKDLFEYFKSSSKLKQIKDTSDYEVEIRYQKDFLNSDGEQDVLDTIHKFKVVGTYKETKAVNEFLEGHAIYTSKYFECPSEMVSYNGFVNLKTGYKNLQKNIDRLAIKLGAGELHLQENKVKLRLSEETMDALSGFDDFYTGILIASAFIIFKRNASI